MAKYARKEFRLTKQNALKRANFLRVQHRTNPLYTGSKVITRKAKGGYNLFVYRKKVK